MEMRFSKDSFSTAVIIVSHAPKISTIYNQSNSLTFKHVIFFPQSLTASAEQTLICNVTKTSWMLTLFVMWEFKPREEENDEKS